MQINLSIAAAATTKGSLRVEVTRQLVAFARAPQASVKGVEGRVLVEMKAQAWALYNALNKGDVRVPSSTKAGREQDAAILLLKVIRIVAGACQAELARRLQVVKAAKGAQQVSRTAAPVAQAKVVTYDDLLEGDALAAEAAFEEAFGTTSRGVDFGAVRLSA